VTGSTSETRLRFVVALAIGAVLVAGLTALVVLIRAGGDPGDAATWPITWELRSSDNGTLFQLFTDVVAGRRLDWSFSPQVYVFPELPISGLAFLLAGGDLYLYYVVVAVLNQVLFFVVLAALARVLWPTGPAVLRAGVAMTPLLLLPLVGTTWVFSFHLAPTYYVGMYLALLAAPLLLLVRTWATRIPLALALALTVASNPLTVVFAVPGCWRCSWLDFCARGPDGSAPRSCSSRPSPSGRRSPASCSPRCRAPGCSPTSTSRCSGRASTPSVRIGRTSCSTRRPGCCCRSASRPRSRASSREW
jgi:hypothetical protein